MEEHVAAAEHVADAVGEFGSCSSSLNFLELLWMHTGSPCHSARDSEWVN